MTQFGAVESASGNQVKLGAIPLASGTVRSSRPVVAVGVYDSMQDLVGSFEFTTEAARNFGEQLIKAADAASKEDN